ncbi:MAG: alpha/beta hydrolase, partial [Nitrososphaeria archaeon]
MNLKRIIFASTAIFLLVAFKLLVLSLDSGETIVTGNLEVEKGGTLFYIAHVPHGGGPKPLSILMHGFGGSSEMMEIMAHELANNGILAIAYDTRGHGKSGLYLPGDQTDIYNDFLKMVDLALEYDAKTDEIALVGHSMGAGFAQAIARNDSRIRCLALLGALPSSDYLDKDSRVNVLVVNGENDEITSVETGFNAFKNITGIENPAVGKTYGSFDDNTAREFYVSSVNDHLTVLYSGDSVQKVVGWVAQFYRIQELSFSNELRLGFYALTSILAYVTIFPLVGVIRDKLETREEHVLEPLKLSRIVPVYLVASFVAAPVALLLQLLLMRLTPLFVSNFLLALFYSQIPAIYLALYAYKRATGKGLRDLLRAHLLRDRIYLRVAYALIVSAIVYFMYYVALQQFLNVEIAAFRLGFTSILAALLIPYTVFNETFFRAVLGTLRRGIIYDALLSASLRISSLLIFYITLSIMSAGAMGMVGYLSIIIYMTALIQLTF